MHMADLKIDTQVHGLDHDVGETARLAEEIGFDAVWNPEVDFDSFLPLPVIAEHTEVITFGPRIATAFTRSPMLLAYKAWDLQRYSEGRFVLGLGTQVKAHNERRFSVPFEWDAPGPRLREVVEAVRHIWEVFQHEDETLSFEGDFYQFSLLPDDFNPGPIENHHIPIHLAGVNEYNLQLAGEIGDGLVLHGFNTPTYTEEVVLPLLARGAERAGRDPREVTVAASPFVVTGRTDEEMRANRTAVKQKIAFYGSTPTYRDVLEVHGWGNVGEELTKLSREDNWADMPDLITPEILDAFAVQAPVDKLAREIEQMYSGIADRVMVDFEGNAYWDQVVADLGEL